MAIRRMQRAGTLPLRSAMGERLPTPIADGCPGAIGRCFVGLARHVAEPRGSWADHVADQCEPEMDDLTRYRLCLLALMNADIDRGERQWQLSLEEARDALRKELKRQGFAGEGPRGRLVVEDFSSLCSAIAQGSTAETLGLLVDVCAADPWPEMKDTPELGTGVREHFLARLSLALPGDTDEDDPEYVDGYLQEGRGLFRRSTAKWIVVLAGAAGAGANATENQVYYTAS
jgi:hypothetical protein